MSNETQTTYDWNPTPQESYDEVDMRLMDTFPASDAVARY